MNVLAIVYPDIEQGKNGRPSWARERAKLSIIPVGTDISKYFSENAEGFAFITIEQARAIEHDFGVERPKSAYTKTIHTRTKGEIEVDVYAFPCIRYNRNGGISAEFNVAYEFDVTMASKEEDRNGTDFHWKGLDFQLKSFGFGEKELLEYQQTGKKKSGVSVCNASLARLQRIADGLE